jgi:predicted GIY-YIG superfamily endonuclease
MAHEVDEPPLAWRTYVLASHDERVTYVGVTTDLERRARQHNGELPGGARSTRRGRPWRVARSFGPFATRAEAQRVEHALKRLRAGARLDWQGPTA